MYSAKCVEYSVNVLYVIICSIADIEGEDYEPEMREIRYPLVTDAVCSVEDRVFESGRFSPSTEQCAGYPNGYQMTCHVS